MERSTTNWKLTRKLGIMSTETEGFNNSGKAKFGDIDCFSHGVCDGALTQLDCASCMNFARKQITKAFPQNVKAQLQLQDWRIINKEYDFTEYLRTCNQMSIHTSAAFIT